MLRDNDICVFAKFYAFKKTATSWDDQCWRLIATADVEDDGQFYECAIYEHTKGGGHCLYFGENEYEGMGKGQKCGTYSFKDGILRDSDGDSIEIKNVVEGRHMQQSEDYAPSASESSESDSEEFQPGCTVRGRGGRGRGRGRGGGRGRGRGRGGRGRGRGRGGRGRGNQQGGTRRRGRGRGRGRCVHRVPLADGQFECELCHLRASCQQAVRTSHDRHFPWCAKFERRTKCSFEYFVEVAKDEVRLQVRRSEYITLQ